MNDSPAAAAALPLLVVLLGPTGSGKTALALSLAERFGGEVVSCDSVAVYREMEIGTAKPTFAERARVPHHLLDVVAPTEQYTAGDYSRAARAAISDIAARGKLPIVSGGTGLYLRALLLGLFAGPRRCDPLRARLRSIAARRGAAHLHRMLLRLDAAAAQGMHANDVPKVIRALEIAFSAGRPMSQAWQQGRDPLTGFRILRIGLKPNRALLYRRINDRAQDMFARGLVDETRTLMDRHGDFAALQSLGYRQARALLRGEISAAQAIAAARQGHRNYAKRQITWFRREPDTHWLAGLGDNAEIRQESISNVDHALTQR